MRRTRLLLLSLSLGLSLAALCICLPRASAQQTATVAGRVLGSSGPIVDAIVRVRATGNVTRTGPNGEFTLRALPKGMQVEVTAWADGYYIKSAYVTPTVKGLDLALRPLHTVDHPEYRWTSPLSGTSPTACAHCHPMLVSRWQANAHGEAIDNPRFFSLYNGSDISGATQQAPGYLLDFPGTAGNCANCHAPGAAVDGYLQTDMNSVRAVITSGIHCDYCHKVADVYLAPDTLSVYPNAPGVQSQRVLRPPPGDNVFFGPFDDIHDPDTYLPLISESQYCAPCHQFSFWGTPIYESYEEWLASPYADDGVTCQNCHMPPSGDEYFALQEKGGLAHPPEQIPSHLQLGAASIDLLQRTVEMTLTVRQVANRALATVHLANTGAGHHVPTDHPGRHLILVVSGTDDQRRSLQQLSGSTVPSWGGSQAGLPGKAFAKVLSDAVSGEFPVVSYWKQTFIVEDNRIPAKSTDMSEYTFAIPPDASEVTLSAQLIIRRLFQELAEQKAWTVADIVMEQRSVTLTPHSHFSLYLPQVDN